MVGANTPQGICLGVQARAVPAVARSFHASTLAPTSFEDSRIGRPHCHHSSLWKIWKPVSANGTVFMSPAAVAI